MAGAVCTGCFRLKTDWIDDVFCKRLHALFGAVSFELGPLIAPSLKFPEFMDF